MDGKGFLFCSRRAKFVCLFALLNLGIGGVIPWSLILMCYPRAFFDVLTWFERHCYYCSVCSLACMRVGHHLHSHDGKPVVSLFDGRPIHAGPAPAPAPIASRFMTKDDCATSGPGSLRPIGAIPAFPSAVA